MNKLIDEKRYDDALNIFDLACQRGFSTANNRKYPSDIVLLAIDALFRQVSFRRSTFDSRFRMNISLSLSEHQRILEENQRNNYSFKRKWIRT